MVPLGLGLCIQLTRNDRHLSPHFLLLKKVSPRALHLITWRFYLWFFLRRGKRRGEAFLCIIDRSIREGRVHVSVVCAFSGLTELWGRAACLCHEYEEGLHTIWGVMKERDMFFMSRSGCGWSILVVIDAFPSLWYCTYKVVRSNVNMNCCKTQSKILETTTLLSYLYGQEQPKGPDTSVGIKYLESRKGLATKPDQNPQVQPTFAMRSVADILNSTTTKRLLNFFSK